LIGLTPLCRHADGFREIGMMLLDHRDHVGGHSVGRAQLKLTASLIKHINSARLCAGKLRRLGNYGIEHGL
jgi:hypothetical protein